VAVFFLFAGATLGVWLSFRFALWPALAVVIFASLCFVIARKRKVMGFFLGGLLLGFLLGLWHPGGLLNKGDYVGVVLETKNDYFLFQSGFSRYYVYEKGTTREVGDILSIYGEGKLFVRTTYESQFNFGEYLYSKGIDHEIAAYTITSKFEMPLRLRTYELHFLSSFDSETRALLDSLLFNHKDYTSANLVAADTIGVLSLFSASGLLFGGFLRGLKALLKLRLSEGKALGCTLIFASLALPFAFGKIGILRVYLLLILRFLNEAAFKKKFSYLELVSFSGLILLGFDFHFGYQTGFLLGYGASLVLLFSRNLIERKDKRWRPFYSSLLLYALLVPVSLSQGSGLHLFYPLFSVVCLPFIYLFSFFGGLSFCSVSFTHLLPFLKDLLSGILSFFVKLDLVVPFAPWSSRFCFCYYLAFLFALIFEDIGYLKMKNLLYFGTLGLYLCSMIPIIPALSSSVSFINVGQGDSILIQDGFTTVMIDTGGNLHFDMAKETLIPYLREQRIYRIDYLIASHGDYDHIGAKDSFCANFNVSHFIDSASSFPLTVGDLSFTNYNTYGGNEENEESLVLSLDFMGYKWLFTGDAPISIEQKIIAAHPELDCDILKLGHHGSDTSSSLAFLKTITPEVAIVSVGAKNTYGHPSPLVLERLRSLGIAIRRTDQEGTITYRKIRGS
jgi:competence protein ComEC